MMSAALAPAKRQQTGGHGCVSGWRSRRWISTSTATRARTMAKRNVRARQRDEDTGGRSRRSAGDPEPEVVAELREWCTVLQEAERLCARLEALAPRGVHLIRELRRLQAAWLRTRWHLFPPEPTRPRSTRTGEP